MTPLLKSARALLFCLMLLFLSIPLVQAQELTPRAYIIPVSGNVEPGMAAILKRSLAGIPQNESPLVIFEIDTFGGRVDSALQIVDTILGVSRGKTLAYVKTKAISAGALISLAAGTLVMREGTTIGDCAPITYSKEGPEMMGEKFQSPLRAKFRALAKRNGFPEVLAEAMVSKEIEVYRITMDGKTMFIDKTAYDDMSQDTKSRISSRETVVAKGQLLTMDDVEAADLGFSKMSVTGIDDMMKRLGYGHFEIIRRAETWSETMVRFLISVTPVLMLIGIAAIYTEIKNPGFGIPGIIGILCLGLALGSQYMVGLADYMELLLIVCGILLLGIEVFVIPGFGIAGIAGFGMILAGLILALQGFTLPDPKLPWETELFIRNITTVMGSFIFAFCISLFFLRYVFPGISKPGKGPYLDTTLKAFHSGKPEKTPPREGDTGRALTDLRPSGKADISGTPHDVITQGEFIEKDTPLRVQEVRGNQILVTARKK